MKTRTINARCEACKRVFSGSSIDSQCESHSKECALLVWIGINTERNYYKERMLYYRSLSSTDIE